MLPFAERFPRLWAFLESLSLLVMAGLFFWVASAAIVTVPAALTALFAAVGGLVRPAAGTGPTRFVQALRRSFGRSMLLGLADLVIGIILYVDVRLFWAMGSPLTKGIALLFGSMGALVVLVNLFAWPLLAWYPQPLGQLIKRSFLLAAAHPLLAVGGVGAVLAVTFLFLLLPPSLLGIFVALGPGVLASVAGAIAWQAMKRYAGPEDGLDV